MGADLLRHTVATLAYRAEKVLRDAPPGFAAFRPGAAATTRTPLDILAHMGDLMEWAARMARGDERWDPAPQSDWDAATARFFRALEALDQALAPAVGVDASEQKGAILAQGPIADALWHTGQLAMLRGMAGAPVRPENFSRAAITVGRVGPEQSPTRTEFSGDASARQP